jgi:hypothetical protein
MANEVIEMDYLWSEPGESKDSDGSPLSSDEEFCATDYDFRFNPLHDLESLWWICLWFLAFHSPAGFKRSFTHEYWYNGMFIAGSTVRSTVLGSQNTFARLRKDLPVPFRRVANTFSKIRKQLIMGYKAAEQSTQEFNATPYADLEVPAIFVMLAKEALEEAPDITFHEPQPTANVEPERKRELGASTASTSGPPLKRAKTTSRAEE